MTFEKRASMPNFQNAINGSVKTNKSSNRHSVTGLLRKQQTNTKPFNRRRSSVVDGNICMTCRQSIPEEQHVEFADSNNQRPYLIHQHTETIIEAAGLSAQLFNPETYKG